jgi:hypothetical protein
MLTTIVITKAAICGWAGQMALAMPKSHAPMPAAVAIRVAAKVLLVEAFTRSDVPQLHHTFDTSHLFPPI